MGKEAKSGPSESALLKMPTLEEESSALLSIQEWLRSQPHLPQNITQKDLLQFLHCCQYKVEKAKRVIDAHYTIRSDTELFNKRDLSSAGFQRFKSFVYFFQLKGTTPLGEKVVFYKFSNPSPDVFDYVESSRYCYAMFDVIQDENDRQPGYVGVLDFQGASLGHLFKLTTHLSLVKKELSYAQQALPFRLCGMHIINTHPVIESFLAFARPFIAGSIMKLIHFYKPNEMHKLYPFVPQEILPKEYGGNAQCLKELSDEAISKLAEREDFVRFKETQKVNEKLRPRSSARSTGSSKRGAFNQLDID